jgi:hypothetical protein
LSPPVVGGRWVGPHLPAGRGLSLQQSGGLVKHGPGRPKGLCTEEQRSCGPVELGPAGPEGHKPGGDLTDLWSAGLAGLRNRGWRSRDPTACRPAAPRAYGAGLGMQHQLFC